jgi:Tetratricopeptide repeat
MDGLDWGFHNLGSLYFDQGKLVEAEQMYERALRGYEKVVGPNHPKSYSLRESIRALDTP